MAYQNLSHTVVTISNKAKLSEIRETKLWDKFHISWLVVRLSILFCQKAILKTRVERSVFSPVMEYGNLSNGYQPIRMGQILWRYNILYRINYI